MPRRPRPGGVRAGTPGRAYANRSDLNTNRSLPVTTAPGQTYGARLAQVEAQHAIPLRPPQPPAPTPAGAGLAQGVPPGPGPPSGPGAGQPIPPGAFGPLERPTERPTEPVTAGAALGPGANTLPPSPFNTGQVSSQSQVSALLAQAGQKLGSPLLAALAARAQAAGQ